MRLLPVVTLPFLFLLGCAAGRETLGPLRVESPYAAPSGLKMGEILHPATGRLLTKAEVLDYVARYPVVYVGESHDSADDHAVQLEILKALQERFPGQVALGLEMLQRPSQGEVDAFVRGDMNEKDFQRVWQRDWNDFFYYRDILLFARENRIPVIALNAGKALRQAVREKGVAGLDPDMAKELPELDFQDPYYKAFVTAMFGGHTMGSLDAETFYRIQVLWDETMAQTAADYLNGPQGQGRHLLILAGGHHVRFGFGIPRRVFRRVPLPYVIVEPYANPAIVEIPKEKRMDVEVPVLPFRSADVYWSVDYRDLKDQQVKLGIRIEDADGKGVRVMGVLPGSAGEKAGLREKDLIVGVDGLDVKEAFDLTYQVGMHKPGDKGALEVLRGEERLSLPVTYDVVKHGK